MNLLRIVVATTSLIASNASLAQDEAERGITWIGEISIAGGGDTLATLFFANGSAQEIKAGNGVTLSGGLIQQFSESFGVRYVLGWKGSWSAADEFDAHKSVIPLALVPFFRAGHHRFGAGVTHHLSPKLEIQSLGTIKFDNATGLVVEYGYAGFTLAYTGINYSIAGTDFDASSVGLRYTIGF